MTGGSSQPDVPAALWQVRLRVASRSLRESWSLFARARIGVIGLVIIVFYALLAAAHPVLMSTLWDQQVYDPVIGYSPGETRQPAPPSLSHPLGTDALGRDILSQLMFSARSEFLLGLLAAIVTVTIGTAVGAVSAYFGGVVDTLLMRFADIMIMMPAMSVLILLSALMSAFPSVKGEKHDLVTLPGEPPDLSDPPAGCRFHPRCSYATDEWRVSEPPIVRRGQHWAACWNPLND